MIFEKLGQLLVSRFDGTDCPRIALKIH